MYGASVFFFFFGYKKRVELELKPFCRSSWGRRLPPCHVMLEMHMFEALLTLLSSSLKLVYSYSFSHIIS